LNTDRRYYVLQIWSECDDVQDYVTIYDGYTTRDPVLLKFCGGGEPVPEAVSSGPEILVEFTSSPYGTFVYPAPLQTLHGFQLEVQVRGSSNRYSPHYFPLISFLTPRLRFPIFYTVGWADITGKTDWSMCSLY
jgi:hypothetical protein